MAFPGSRTKTTDVWLLPEDEALVGKRIGEALPRSGWLCSHPGPKGLHQVHLHPSVPSALTCGGRQAFLLLPTGAAVPSDVVLTSETPSPRPDLAHRAVLQLLCSRRVQERQGEVLEAGRLAVRWFEAEVGAETHLLLTEETRTVWKALRSATRPAVVEDQHGRRTAGMRIGAAAHELVTNSRMPLTRGGAERLHLVAQPS
ncbi:hypothetical protein ASE03_30165 [Kitasatospora sp. Root187]|nr:hypothetical protein ASC99_30380 [Kitasatospora sp. Root107]KRB68205.1 hypothetical protein ASE03_30165 [Kitasatospora sp. Root187]